MFSKKWRKCRILSGFMQNWKLACARPMLSVFLQHHRICGGSGKPFRFPAGTLIIDRIPDGDGRRPYPGGLERLFPCAESLQR